LLHNRTVIFEDVQHETRFENPALYRDHKIISGAVVPIAGRHGSYGVLHALSAVKRKFTADDVSFLESTANIVTTAIQRRSLEEEVVKIAENEQRRIGEDLHDNVCQDLISAGLFAKNLQQKLLAKSLPESDEAGELMRIACDAAKRVREIARGFIPAEFNADSFAALLRASTKDVNKRSSIMCHCRLGRGIDMPSNFVAYQLFRIAQEALNNVIKHSHAKQVWIVLSAAHGKMKLTIKDDGIGISPSAATEGMGLHIMRYRASSIDGVLSINCRPGGGTILSCKLENRVRRKSVQESIGIQHAS
jgi:signal transduction histidine kinase